MNVVKTSLALHSLPLQIHTKTGEPVSLELLEEQLHQQLVEMYLAYRPRGTFQELPPLKDSVCVKWVQDTINAGINIVAISCENGIVGHAALFPITDLRCELLVVVSPAYQCMGIGTGLILCCIEIACDLGFEQIWLPVDAGNLRARHVYRKCGFEYVSDQQAYQMDMVCNLKRSPSPSSSLG